MPTPPRQPPQTPTLDGFVQQIGALAQQLGINVLVIVGKDPVTNEQKLYGAKPAMEEVRDLVGEKFGFYGETSWEDR